MAFAISALMTPLKAEAHFHSQMDGTNLCLRNEMTPAEPLAGTVAAHLVAGRCQSRGSLSLQFGRLRNGLFTDWSEVMASVKTQVFRMQSGLRASFVQLILSESIRAAALFKKFHSHGNGIFAKRTTSMGLQLRS
ncbi:hypothetical protein AVEN_162533-1 [Araneus ventricosus]|uniref:Uncharacterized protein n=1 Tax=Araneus ventricosus TaxID=182803 RepID=A0A4Y2I590_ARAVE|nr:hypothetical protein AVEN_162533-1 [Araneus ventricosus]